MYVALDGAQAKQSQRAGDAPHFRPLEQPLSQLAARAALGSRGGRTIGRRLCNPGVIWMGHEVHVIWLAGQSQAVLSLRARERESVSLRRPARAANG